MMKAHEFAAVEAFAKNLLGTAEVVSVTAASLRKRGEDVARLSSLIQHYTSLPSAERNFEIKKSLGEPDTPDDFAFFVRRRPAPAPP
jgi:hypothetical protein